MGNKLSKKGFKVLVRARVSYRKRYDNDNDNDNDTLREVPHQSNEGLALQARVSGPWLHKKESVLLGKLARWQGAQKQTVMDRV